MLSSERIWRNENTYIDKIIEQNRGLTALADKLKPKELEKN